MKKKIHPNYGPAVIRCACGNVMETRSTKPEIAVDVCSACHPLFTGRQKLVDTAGRIDKFQKKYGGKTTGKKEKKQEQEQKQEPQAEPQA